MVPIHLPFQQAIPAQKGNSPAFIQGTFISTPCSRVVTVLVSMAMAAQTKILRVAGSQGLVRGNKILPLESYSKLWQYFLKEGGSISI